MSAPYVVIVKSQLDRYATPNAYGPFDEDEASSVVRLILEKNEHVDVVALPLSGFIER